MGSHGPGRKRTPNRNGVTPEEDALNVIAREAEARLAAKRAARAEAREIRMKELERQQKEIYQVQKKYYGLENLDSKWGDIEQWMEDSERYTRHSRRHGSMSDDEERMSVGSKSSTRLSQMSLPTHKSSKKKKKMKHSPEFLSEYSGLLRSSSRTSSRTSSRCASPVENSSSSVASFLRKAANSSGLSRDLDYVTIPDLPNVSGKLLRLDDRLERETFEKGSSRVSAMSTVTLTSHGGTSSRRGSGDSSVTADTEASLHELKEIHELKDQIQNVEAKYMQSLKEVKDSLVEMEEKYRKAMVSNAQLDNEKSNFMYEVDTLKDSLMELEELLAETRRELGEKSKDLEREKHAHSILQFKFDELKETLKQSDELLTEIRQLRLKQDGFVREISDLQETIEWKNKKVGALEKQKEYSDAIRNERDELRDEVVQLKDILKKHGIVIGSDLNTHKDVADGSSGNDVQQGSSILGTQEWQLGRDENLGGSRGSQFQQPRHFDHGLQENGPPSHVSGGSSESCLVAQKEDVNQGNDLNKDLRAFQNCDVDTSVPVSKTELKDEVEEVVVEKNLKGEVVEFEPVAITRKDVRTDQKSPVFVQSQETVKEEILAEDEKQVCENVVRNIQAEKISEVPSEKIDANDSQSKNLCASGKKKKKKRKSKHKQKQDCHEKEGNAETGNLNEQQPEPSRESAKSEQIATQLNNEAKMDPVKNEDDSGEFQIHDTDILKSATNVQGSDSAPIIDSNIPTDDLPFQSTTSDVKSSDQLVTTNAEATLLSNMDDTPAIDEQGAQLVDMVAETYMGSNRSDVPLEDQSHAKDAAQLSEEVKDDQDLLAGHESKVKLDEDDECAESPESGGLHLEEPTEGTTECLSAKPDIADMGSEEPMHTECQQDHESIAACSEQTGETQMVLNAQNTSVDQELQID
ncbi:leucine-rich repeat flightless-interacting protein 2 isoform X3 [Trichomycterus rosablanca]|uniref:leucine-rich repeat flightless-interacting protein 2 isoform X3 n=1 Tax=Trichomycterus rosablanca TaxID=2290929 RepID=UPI002F356630